LVLHAIPNFQSQSLNKKLLKKKKVKIKKLKTCEREKGIATHAILLSIAWDLKYCMGSQLKFLTL
jgi:hypothetical protein